MAASTAEAMLADARFNGQAAKTSALPAQCNVRVCVCVLLFGATVFENDKADRSV